MVSQKSYKPAAFGNWDAFPTVKQPYYAMIQSAKKVIHKLLRLLLFPFRKVSNRRNGIHQHSPKMEIPNHILLGSARDAIKDGHTVTISVKGWSMRPFLEHLRDKVVLDSPQGAKVGDAVLAEISSGHFVLHRIIDIKHTQEDCQLDEITLMGDGNIHGTEHCLRKDICGIVTHYIRPNRTLSATDPKLIRNINIWKKLLPIRRFLLVIYKALI